MNYLDVADMLRVIKQDYEKTQPKEQHLAGQIMWNMVVNNIINNRFGNYYKFDSARFRFAIRKKTCGRVNCDNFTYPILENQEGRVCGDCLCGDI